VGVLQRIANLVSTFERRELPSDPYWANFAAMRGIGSPSPDNVLSNLATAARCVALRSEILASVPLFLYRRDASGGRERASDLPLYSCLHDISNASQSAFEFRELLIRSLDLYGNFFARIERNARGQVTSLWPISNGDVEVQKLPNGRLRYKVFLGSRNETFLQEEVLHVRGPSRDGVVGQSPISIARGSLSLALQHAATAASFSSNGLRPGGLLSYPQNLDKDQVQQVRDRVNDAVGGPFNSGKLLVVNGGAKYEALSFSPEDSQFLEQRKLANEDVCRVFGVPPTCAGILDRGTFSNVEQEAASLVQNCLGPLCKRVETSLARCLLTDVGRRTLYIEHELDGLLRGDVKSRFESYRLAREIGVYSSNDIRRKENEPPIPGGDTYSEPVNWAPLGTAPQGAQGQ
jgi:HK97 family phage portal protein